MKLERREALGGTYDYYVDGQLTTLTDMSILVCACESKTSKRIAQLVTMGGAWTVNVTGLIASKLINRSGV